MIFPSPSVHSPIKSGLPQFCHVIRPCFACSQERDLRGCEDFQLGCAWVWWHLKWCVSLFIFVSSVHIVCGRMRVVYVCGWQISLWLFEAFRTLSSRPVQRRTLVREQRNLPNSMVSKILLEGDQPMQQLTNSTTLLLCAIVISDGQLRGAACMQRYQHYLHWWVQPIASRSRRQEHGTWQSKPLFSVVGLAHQVSHFFFFFGMDLMVQHVLCEKPLGMNAKEVQDMILSSRKNKVFLMEAMVHNSA